VLSPRVVARGAGVAVLLAGLAACNPPTGGGAPDVPTVAPAAASTAGAGAVVPSDAPPDADRDGVADVADRCADTGAGLAVDPEGCPVDADADGVPAANDLCPDSPVGEPVDQSGCRPRLMVPQEYTLLLNFETGSAKVVGEPRAALAEVAALMTQYPETSVTIEGHTDNTGARRFNMKVSEQRAAAVAKVLIGDLGIDAARVASKGFGGTRPIATNATKQGRERNRRVVAVVVPGPEPGGERADAPTAVAP
jgi:OOP family OmpA-OmpF porin